LGYSLVSLHEAYGYDPDVNNRYYIAQFDDIRKTNSAEIAMMIHAASLN
jgi:hypothetical protein